MMLYVASPFSRYPNGPDAAFQEIARICGKLVAKGMDVYSPIMHSWPLALYAKLNPFDVKLWQRVDAPFIALCSECLIAKMIGWETSVGICEEIAAFRKAGKPVRYLDPWTMEISDSPNDKSSSALGKGARNGESAPQGGSLRTSSNSNECGQL